jgi:ribonuclease III
LNEALERLGRALDYRFQNPDLLTRALTHRSVGAANYERLEFLGDGLLNFLVGEMLYEARADWEEGDLSRLRASLVREASLAALAERLELGETLILGPGELRSGGFRRHSILADAFEAVLGAVYLDGGFAAAREVCRRLYADAMRQLPDPAEAKDAKTRLQEWLQARGRPLPVYDLTDTAGPPHRQAFTVACRLVDDGGRTEGRSDSRKGAEQAAAEKMLERLRHA